jgi:hypothetical protein
MLEPACLSEKMCFFATKSLHPLSCPLEERPGKNFSRYCSLLEYFCGALNGEVFPLQTAGVFLPVRRFSQTVFVQK